MFGRTKRKIVFTVVFSLLALMSVTLVTIYLSNRFALRRENEEVLRMYAERYSLTGQPSAPSDGERPGDIPENMTEGQPDDAPGDAQDVAPGDPAGEIPGERPGPKNGGHFGGEPRFNLSTFYSVAYGPDGEVLAVNNGNNGLHSEEELLSISSSIISGGRKSGKKGNLTYRVDERQSYTLVSMIDGTIDERNQLTLIRQMLAIGGAAMLVLAVVSFFIARRIVRPLEENDRKQKRFVSDAGHELKTPIAVISANSELLRRESGGSEWLDNIDYENAKMSELVKQLLTLSKAGNGDLPKEAVDLSRLADGEILAFESLAFEKGVRLDSDVEPGITVEGNRSQLCQLVSILLDNALSHGTGGTIGVSLKKEKHSAVLTVSNDADPISPEQLEHLFDRFYRTDESRGGDGAHYGLGLSIALAVAETHGGNIRAAYRNGRAVFTVAIPVKK